MENFLISAEPFISEFAGFIFVFMFFLASLPLTIGIIATTRRKPVVRFINRRKKGVAITFEDRRKKLSIA